MVMGKVKRGGSGCYCSENTLLQALMAHLLVSRNEVVLLDMAAGIEHLGRATAKAVDIFIVVVEPGKKSIETALRIKRLAQDIGVTRIVVVGNKIRNHADKEYIINSLQGIEIFGFIPYDTAIIDADISNIVPSEASHAVNREVHNIYLRLVGNKS
jgi:CO dehydrogenase maturation factor